VAKKSLSSNILCRSGRACLRRTCARESGFVNYGQIVSNRFVPPRFSHSPPMRRWP